MVSPDKQSKCDQANQSQQITEHGKPACLENASDHADQTLNRADRRQCQSDIRPQRCNSFVVHSLILLHLVFRFQKLIAGSAGVIVSSDFASSANVSETETQLFIVYKITLTGLNLLKQVLLNIIGKTPNDEGLFLARTRHLEALQNALSELDNALIYLQQNDLLAEHLRHTQNELGKITGEFSPDDLLGEIFSRFCIGK